MAFRGWHDLACIVKRDLRTGVFVRNTTSGRKVIGKFILCSRVVFPIRIIKTPSGTRGGLSRIGNITSEHRINFPINFPEHELYLERIYTVDDIPLYA